MTVITAMGKYTSVQTEYAIKDNLPRDATNVTAQIIVGTPGHDVRSAAAQGARCIHSLYLSLVNTQAGHRCDACQGFRPRRSRQYARPRRAWRADPPCQKVRMSQRTPFSHSSPIASSAQSSFRSSSSPQPSPTTYVHTPQRSRQTQTRSNCRRRSSASTTSGNSTWTAAIAEHKYDILVSLYQLLTIGPEHYLLPGALRLLFIAARGILIPNVHTYPFIASPSQHRHTADRISQRMTAEGHRVASLHGAKDAAERDAIIDRFREGREKVLITTNVIARGIDIMQVNMVVNYDLPLMNERGQRRGRASGHRDVYTPHRTYWALWSPRGCQSILCMIRRRGCRWSRSRRPLAEK